MKFLLYIEQIINGEKIIYIIMKFMDKNYIYKQILFILLIILKNWE